MERILCAKDTGVGYSTSFGWFEPGTPSGGVIRPVGIGKTASSSSVAVEEGLDNVGDGLELRSALTVSKAGIPRDRWWS